MYSTIKLHKYEGGDNMGNSIFGKRISKLRKDRNMTMEDVANAVNTTKSSVNMWENADVIPRESILIELSKVFNVSIDYLLGNDKMEDKVPENKKLQVIQRGLENLDEERLAKAEIILETVFGDIFNDDSGDDDDDI